MTRIPLANLLTYRLVLFNAAAGALCTWAYAKGYIAWLWSFESTGIGYGLVALTLAAILGTFHRAHKVGKAFDAVKGGEWVDTRKLLIKSGYIALIAKCLMFIGLWANSFGIFISFVSVDFTSVDTILSSVSSMYGGLKIAFVNTLISIALYLAVAINLHILVTATKLLGIDAAALKGGAK